MEAMSAQVSVEILISLFPFHIIVDRDLVIRNIGASLAKAGPDVRLCAHLTDVFDLVQPRIIPTFDGFISQLNAMVILRAHKSGLNLKGQAVFLAESNTLFIAAAPWLTDATQFKASGLVLSDFAAYDNTIEYLIALEANAASLADSRMLTQTLSEERKMLKESNEQLIASREQYRYVVETVREVVFATDEEDRITFLNPFWQEVTGYSLKESIGVDILHFLHPDDKAQSRELLNALKERILPYGRHHIRLVTKDGESRWFEALLRLIIDQDDVTRGLSGTLNDITKRKMAEAQLRDSEVRLRSIITTAVEAIIVINSSGVIEEFNPAAEKMFGYAAFEVVGKNVACLMPHPAQHDHDRFVRRFLETGVNRVIGVGREEIALRKDGTQFAIDLSVSEMVIGQDVKFTGFVRDITQRKAVEEALLESERLERTTRERLAYLHEIGISLSSIDEPDDMCLRAIELGRDWLGFDRLSLWFYDHKAGVMRGTYGTDEAGEIRDERGQSYVSEHYLNLQNGAYGRYTVPKKVTFHKKGTVLMGDNTNAVGTGERCDVMLWDGAKAIGTLFGDNLISGRPITQRDVDILELYAETIGHLYSKLLIQQQLRENVDALAKSNRLEAEIGGRIQQSLLGAPSPGDIEGVNVASVTLPSRDVDGDCYDFFRHNSDVFDVLIADVMGKGVPAALLSAAIKAQFQRAVRGLCSDLGQFDRLPEPFEIVNAVNCAINGELQALSSFITVCYARVDLLNSKVTFVDCGHPPTILFHPEQDSYELLSGDNCPLGFLDNDVYHQREANIQPGDVLLFYSDGMTELRNDRGGMWGEEGVMRALRLADKTDAIAIVRSIQREAIAFRGNEPQSDDLTCVVVQVGIREKSSLLYRIKREFRSSFDELDAIRNFISTPAASVLDEDAVSALVLAANEAATNIVQHAYSKEAGCRIQSSVEIFTDRVRVRFQDTGKVFDASRVSPPAFDGSQSNGFGVFIMEQLLDEVRRTRDEYGHNLLELVKRTGA